MSGLSRNAAVVETRGIIQAPAGRLKILAILGTVLHRIIVIITLLEIVRRWFLLTAAYGWVL